MFSPLDILLGVAGVLVALAVSAPFLMLRRSHVRATRHAAAAPVPVPVELQRQIAS